jgi:two-component system phosphate regulon sensor histidine kinase PhoR
MLKFVNFQSVRVSQRIFAYMKRKTLNGIVFLMTLALVGLVIFQTYWISGAIEINRKKFVQNVHEALRSVSDQLEQQEVMYTLYNKMLYGNLGDQSVQRPDSAFYSSTDTLSGPRTGRHLYRIPRGLRDSTTIRSGTLSRSFSIRGRNDSGIVEQRFDTNISMEFQQFAGTVDSVRGGNVEIRREKLLEKSQMITIVLDQLLTDRRSIRSRVDQVQLDTLLQRALQDRGIDIPYYYAVLNEDTRSVVMTNAQHTVKPLVDSEYKTGLFTRDVITSPNKLAIYFPGQRKFLLGKIWITLASSGLLLLTIMVCFAYALHIIVKQKKISEIKNDFINNMTHEFKTPISTVSLACEALKDGDLHRDAGRIDKYVSIIQAENARLGMQVERVLQIAQLERKDIKLKPEVLDIHNIVDAAIQNIRIQVEKRNGKIETKYGAAYTLVYADEVHLTNIVFNLLDNANKYSDNTPVISVETSESADHIVLRVSDKGVGMTQEATNRIFEKFYRVPTGNIHNVKGFGLGLAYVKTMVEMMHGQIGVRSAPGKGSTFTLTLPKYAESQHTAR